MLRGLWKLTWIETKIFLREPLGAVGTIGIPVLVFLAGGRLLGGSDVPEANEVIKQVIANLRRGSKSLVPFHWELEFPEVFGSERNDGCKGGFDVIVGNPPFLGGARISTNFGMPYFSYLTTSYPPAGHQCDLVGYFFRRAFTLATNGGTIGLIATKTIAQGDTLEREV